ncbi:MAG: TIGR00266 family protein [Magnetococcales bacterium]|nr:TIGR00266 family protein [Magnetococcales bacterium]
MQCHEVDYRILGTDTQLVEVVLDPGETVIAEAGAMNYMDGGIRFETRLGDGSRPTSGFFGKLWDAGSRMLTGESLFLTHFSNEGPGRQTVAFAAPSPGPVIPVHLGEIGGEILCQKDAFLAAALGTRISLGFNRRLGSGFFGGEGFILQKLQGDGLVFIHAGGCVVEKRLDNSTLLVDTGCLVAFTPGIDFDIQLAGGLKSMIFGGEGLFLATLRGTGRVWLQSMPFSRLVERIAAGLPKPPANREDRT